MKTTLVPILGLWLLTNIAWSLSEEQNDTPETRDGKLLPIFQVVRFPNDVCSATTRNGTCYTAEECSSRGGKSGGSCASGFGVCCIMELSCGGTTSDNNSYIVQASATSVDSPCDYTVCPCNNNICRIRYDFTTFVIGAQTAGTGAAAGVAANALADTAVGGCQIDSFEITAPGAVGSPVICGTNTGYHMILDAHNSECQKANFAIGPSTTTTRSWDIKVTQYACGDEDKAGPPGCLQYFTGTSGVVASFGFPPSATTVAVSYTHLQNQHYETCYRREKGYCYHCFTATITAAAPNSFGLSISDVAAIAHHTTGTLCSTDYITIPGATTGTIAATTTQSIAITKICGRFLSMAATEAAIQSTVCTRLTPFRLGVHFDSSEYLSNADATDAITNEQDLTPNGIIGFKLTWFQGTC